MPSIAYYEDTDFDVDLDDDDIRKCSDVAQLTEWQDDCDAAIQDIKAQIEASALGGCAERAWVYRAGKAMGFMARARSRVAGRLLALGVLPPQRTHEIAKLHRDLASAKARNAVAVEFLRLCEEGAFPDRAIFSRVEKRAVALVADREAETARKAAKHADLQSKVAA